MRNRESSPGNKKFKMFSSPEKKVWIITPKSDLSKTMINTASNPSNINFEYWKEEIFKKDWQTDRQTIIELAWKGPTVFKGGWNSREEHVEVVFKVYEQTSKQENVSLHTQLNHHHSTTHEQTLKIILTVWAWKLEQKERKKERNLSLPLDGAYCDQKKQQVGLNHRG